MAFENIDNDMDMEPVEGGEMPPEESSNRTFIIVAVVLGIIMVLSIVCIGAFAVLKVLPDQRTKSTQAALILTQNAEKELSAAQTAEALSQVTPTSTATKIPPSATPAPTKTPLLPTVPTNTPLVGGGPNPETVAALNTKVAEAQLTPSPTIAPTGTIPQGGFADEVGLPGLLGLAAVLIVIIFFARRLRTAS